MSELTPTEKEVMCVGAFLGLIGGIALSFGIYFWMPRDVYSRAKKFDHENGRSVIRLYRNGTDQILVEEDESGNSYITLYEHLKKIRDVADKQIERAKIEKLVGWYESR